MYHSNKPENILSQSWSLNYEYSLSKSSNPLERTQRKRIISQGDMSHSNERENMLPQMWSLNYEYSPRVQILLREDSVSMLISKHISSLKEKFSKGFVLPLGDHYLFALIVKDEAQKNHP